MESPSTNLEEAPAPAADLEEAPDPSPPADLEADVEAAAPTTAAAEEAPAESRSRQVQNGHCNCKPNTRANRMWCADLPDRAPDAEKYTRLEEVKAKLVKAEPSGRLSSYGFTDSQVTGISARISAHSWVITPWFYRAITLDPPTFRMVTVAFLGLNDQQNFHRD